MPLSASQGFDVGRLDSHRAGDGDLAAHVVLARGEELADRDEAGEGDRPDGVFLADRGEVADLHAHVAGGVRTAEGVQLAVLQARESGGGFVAVKADVDLAVRQFGEGADARLGGGQLAAEAESGVRGQRRGAEGGDEDVARTDLGVGEDAVRALDQPGPQAALEKRLAHLRGVQLACVLSSEVDALPLAVRFDQDGQQLAFLATDNLLDRTAHGGGQEDVGVLFVCSDGGTAEHGIAFLDQQSREETLEVRRLDGHNARRNRL